MKKPLVLHPFFFAIYPVLSLLALNINQIGPEDSFRSFGVLVVISAVFLYLFQLVTKEWQRAGLAVSWLLLFFFSPGHVIRALQGIFPYDWVELIYRFLIALWAVFAILGPWWIVRFWRRDVSAMTQFLNVVSGVALVFPIFTISTAAIAAAGKNPTDVTSASTAVTAPPDDLPDIYYIILDGYGRSDVLQEIYQLDNSNFLDFLAEQGFYVAPNSHSNYNQTILSLPSSLNMRYLDDLSAQVGKETQNRVYLEEMIHQSQVISFLKGQGYQIVATATGYAPTEMPDADVYLPNQAEFINKFEEILLGDTIPGPIVLARTIYFQLHRQLVNNSFEQLEAAAIIPGPKFVFAHILAPHPPFVFNAAGEPVQPSILFSFNERLSAGISLEEYTTGYSQQIVYITQRIQETIEYILLHSDEPVIVIQGDHGSGAFLVWESVEETCVRERYSILNAYLVPNEVRAQMYDSITPVNTFRVIFDTLFDADLEVLPDKSYFASWDRPYDYIDVTDQFEASCISSPS